MKWRVPLHMKSNVWERYRRLQPSLHLERMSLAGEHGGFLLPMDQTKCGRHISEKYSLAVANCPKDMGKPNLFEFPSQAALSWSIRFNISFPSKIQLLGLLCLYQWLDTHYHKYVPRMPKTWIEKMILNNGVTDFTRSLSQSGCQSNFSVFPSARVVATERDN